MIFIDTLRMALFEFGSNKLRTGLTMLGIVIGVGAVIALMAAGQGAQAGVTNKVRGLGSNLIFIKPATTGSSGGGLRNLRSLTLTTDDAAALRDKTTFPEIQSVVSQFGGSDTSAAGVGRVNLPVIVGHDIDFAAITRCVQGQPTANLSPRHVPIHAQRWWAVRRRRSGAGQHVRVRASLPLRRRAIARARGRFRDRMIRVRAAQRSELSRR